MINLLLDYLKQPAQIKTIANSIQIDAKHSLERKLKEVTSIPHIKKYFNGNGHKNNNFGESATVYEYVMDAMLASGIIDHPYY